MFSTTVGIKGTFDIAIARNLIRSQLITNRRIMPSVNVRTTVALTSLGELIISMQVDKAVPVKLQLIERDGHFFLEYSCSVPYSSANDTNTDRYRHNLERVSNSIDIQKNNSNWQIDGYIQLDGDGV